jgi:hypothetical protein
LVLLPHPATQAKAAVATTLMANRCTEFISFLPWTWAVSWRSDFSGSPIVTFNTRLIAEARSIRDSR